MITTKLGQLRFITNWSKCYYKLEQLHFIPNWGKCYYKLAQLNYYKPGQVSLQIRAAITNSGNRYYKFGQLLQIEAIITNWGHNR